MCPGRACGWLQKVAIAAFLIAATGCGESAAPAMLVETTDPVTVNGHAVHALPTAPISLAAGDALEVGPKGMARLLYPDGSRFMLMSRDAEPASLAVTARAADAGHVVIKLLKGVLAFLVPPDRKVKDRYELKALNTVTTIEGTAGRVITTVAEDSVALEHGTVLVVANGGEQTRIKGLQEAIFNLLAGKFKLLSYDPTATGEKDLYSGSEDKKILNH